MISIILYGRNDNYGYNLHKRAALSLNCMAAVLTAPDDEILFVDYNTPDDFPTFPEAIRDTLTPRAQNLLRILRVRPAQHSRFLDRTHLKALEPISRNVALRRSNPNNRWILSTNTDMIFVPRGLRSLSGVVGDLEGRFYHLPRFEVPEYLWETLDRTDPEGVIAQVGRWGWTLHLNEVVFGEAINRFDGPGDFQLALRDDLFRIDGFDERMLIGWHVDSNLAARMALIYGQPDTLLDDMFGYHCDHTRQVTPAHSHNRVQNDWRVFVDAVSTPDIPSQAESWGLADEEVEEIRLVKGARLYLHALHKAVGEPMREMTGISYLDYDRISYDSRHVLPFLLDAFTAYPSGVSVAWFGARADLLQRFAIAWEAMGRGGAILVSDRADWLPDDLPACCRRGTAAAAVGVADIIVFDFGLSALPADGEATADRTDVPRILRHVELAFRAVVDSERQRQSAGLPPRRLIAVNAIGNRYAPLVDGNVAITLAPIGTRLRQGFVLPLDVDIDLLPILFPGQDAGENRAGGGFAARPGAVGVMVFGLYLDLPAGRYRLTLETGLDGAYSAEMEARPLRLEIMGGGYCLATRYLSVAELRAGNIVCLFDMPHAPELRTALLPVQLVVTTDGGCAAMVTGGRLAPAAASDMQPAGTCEPLAPEVEWLPLMRRGEAAIVRPDGWHAGTGSAQHVAFGPYVTLLPGPYEVVFTFHSDAGQTGDGLSADVLVPDTGEVLARAEFTPDRPARELVLEFEVSGEGFGVTAPKRLEFRLFTLGRQKGRLLGIATRRLSNPAQHQAVLEAAAF